MKALALLSGGLDSRLAIKLMLEQGIDVIALHFKLPFEGCCLPDCSFKFSQLEMIPLYVVDATKGKAFQEYIKLVKKPQYGYGTAINPCIDCHIFMLKKAKQLAKKLKCNVIVTGEVVDERPMSQRMKTLELIEQEAGLKGQILRPLSAKLLPETEAEKKGKVDRSKLLGIRGRRRNIQFALAKKFKLRNFPMPGGGCILCEKEFAKKLIDLFKNKKTITGNDIQLLRIGRHFRFNKNKIIVGRNEQENNQLIKLKNKNSYLFEVLNVGSPIAILEGKATKRAIETAAQLTARYSDSKDKKIAVNYGMSKPTKKINVGKLNEKDLEKLRL